MTIDAAAVPPEYLLERRMYRELPRRRMAIDDYEPLIVISAENDVVLSWVMLVAMRRGS